MSRDLNSDAPVEAQGGSALHREAMRAQRGRGGQDTPKSLVQWWERRGDRGGTSTAQATPCTRDLHPWRGPQCGGDVPRNLPRTADVTGMEKSKCFPFIWKGGKEKPGNYGVNCVQPLEKYRNASKTLLWEPGR